METVSGKECELKLQEISNYISKTNKEFEQLKRDNERLRSALLFVKRTITQLPETEIIIRYIDNELD